MGSKNRIAKHILPIMLESFYDSDCEIFIDCTVGGGNLLDKVPDAIPRYGVDINEYLIAMWKAVSAGWIPPKNITEEQYYYTRDHKDEDKALTGYVGFALSYGGKWFGGWCRDSAGQRDYVSESYRNALKQFPLLRGVSFDCRSLFDVVPKKKALLYYDPPYKGTTSYKDKFNHERFYDTCRQRALEGNVVYISEYSMPDDFKCVWSKEVVSSLTKDTGSKRGLEKLYTII